MTVGLPLKHLERLKVGAVPSPELENHRSRFDEPLLYRSRKEQLKTMSRS